VASIAFGEPVAAVDGNVTRVLSRLHALDGHGSVAELAQAWLSRRAPGTSNQAFMELGATVCTPRAPECPRCPLREVCEGRAAPERYPAARPRARPVREHRAVTFACRDGKVFLTRHNGTGLLAGMWDLPATRRGGESGAPLAVVRHGVLNRHIEIAVYPGRARGAGRWFTARQLARIPLATAARKCLRGTGFELGDIRG
jgi:A/G-specific adenine glycosylase